MDLVAVVAAVLAVLLLGWCWRRSTEREARRRMELGHANEASAVDVADEWEALLGRTDVLLLDTETTGLGNRAEVIEVAVLDTTGALRCEALAMPEGRIPRDATTVHGLSRARLRAGGARPWSDVHAELLDVLDGATAVLAWNPAFDRRMLEQTSARHGLGFARIRFRDVMEEYRNLRSEARGKDRHSLSAVATRERIGSFEAYRAAGDCRAVARDHASGGPPEVARWSGLDPGTRPRRSKRPAVPCVAHCEGFCHCRMARYARERPRPLMRLKTALPVDGPAGACRHESPPARLLRVRRAEVPRRVECGRCRGTGRAPESATAHVERYGDLRVSGSAGPGRAERKPVIRTRRRRWTPTPEGRG